jgi:hypothetical protein
MLVARTGFAGVPWGGGKLYVFGGTDFTQNLSDSEVYDPTANSWSEIAPLPRAVSFMGAATGSDLRIYVVGGWDGKASVNWVQAYDPKTNSWACSFAGSGCTSSNLAPLPTARASLALVPVGSGHVIFALGGFTTKPVTTDEVYSPLHNVWLPGSPLRHPASGLAATFVPPTSLNPAAPVQLSRSRVQAPSTGTGDLLTFGGNNDTTFNNQFDAKPMTEQPDPNPSPQGPDVFPDPGLEPFPFDFPEPPLLLPDYPDDDPFDDIPEPPPLPEPDFDPTASDPLWQSEMLLDPFPLNYAFFRSTLVKSQAGASLPLHGSVYVIGAETGATDPVHVYDPVTHTWMDGPQLHTARVSSWAVLTHSRMLYVIGGNDAFNHVYSMVDALTLPPLPPEPTRTPTPTLEPVATTTPTTTPTPRPTSTATATTVPAATSTPVRKKTCPKYSVKKHGRCACKKGYHKAHGKCVKVKHKR